MGIVYRSGMNLSQTKAPDDSILLLLGGECFAVLKFDSGAIAFKFQKAGANSVPCKVSGLGV